MTPTETIECIQACTVTLAQGTDYFGPGVGLAGVLIGGLIGFLGLRWQHKQNHRQVILREVAQMHAALEGAWEISSELRTTANPSASVKPMGMDSSKESLAKLESRSHQTGQSAALLNLLAPGPLGNEATHADGLLKSLVRQVEANSKSGASFSSTNFASSVESVWQAMQKVTDVATTRFGK